MGFVREGDVEIFGKTVGLEEAFLETGASLEHPAVGDLGVGRDAGEGPAERIVFFYDVRIEIELARKADDFRFADQPRSFPPQPAGTRRCQRVTSRGHSSAGSSFA